MQMFGTKDANFIALYALDQSLIAKLRGEYPTMDVLFVDQSQYANRIAETRYELALRCIDRFVQEPVLAGEHYVVKRVGLASK